MLKIRIFAIGNLKEKYLKDALDEYKKRLSKYVSLEIIECKESIRIENINEALEYEANEIIKKINEKDYIFLLDLHGNEYDSIQFSKKISELKDRGISPINFVIGGTLGLSDKLRKISNDSFCLSKLTFTHQFSRIILLEQIYRAFKIINNEQYHH